MKIASPLSRVREVAPLASAGAGELYCSVVPAQWRQKFGFVESISRRNNPSAHLNSLADLEKTVKTSSRLGISVYVAVNESYHAAQMDFLAGHIRDIAATGAAGIIFGDPATLTAARQAGYTGKAVMGTGGVILNSETVKFYQALGVSRMILDRHLSPDEIREITLQAPGPEYEVFVFRGLCPFIDGICRFQHGINQALGRKPAVDLACSLRFHISTIPSPGCQPPKNNAQIKKMMSPRQSLTGCAACSLFDLTAIKGVTSLKIVGREFSTPEKVANVRFVKGLLNLLMDNPHIQRQEFCLLCKERFQEFFGKNCTPKDCYPAL